MSAGLTSLIGRMMFLYAPRRTAAQRIRMHGVAVCGFRDAAPPSPKVDGVSNLCVLMLLRMPDLVPVAREPVRVGNQQLEATSLFQPAIFP